jgi:hypothetical protein
VVDVFFCSLETLRGHDFVGSRPESFCDLLC